MYEAVSDQAAAAPDAHVLLDELESDLAYAGLSRGAPRIARWYSASNTGSSIDP